jgi:predicted MFS family arabinose efflux permease
MPGWMVGLFAVSCGLTVATNYYVQVLIPAIAHELRMPGATVGLLVPLAQIGFVVGILFIVPLGDLLQRRRLVSVLLIGTALALAVAAVAWNFTVLATATLAAGVCSVAAQVLVALSATLAAPDRQGRVVGQVMSGLLIGVLLARTVAGIVAAGWGWRWVYASAAILMAVLAGVLRVALPEVAASSDLPYRRLLLSVGRLLVVHPQLRVRIIYGAVTFAGFGALWTTIALLAADRYHYNEATIGLLALVGAIGALAAQGSGRLVDAGLLHVATGAFLLTILGGWVAGAYGGNSLAALILSLILIDLGVQGIHIANQSAIYRLDPGARNRITTAYIALYFCGGAIGSVTAAIAYGRAGWSAVVVSGIVFTAIGIVIWALPARNARLRADRRRRSA